MSPLKLAILTLAGILLAACENRISRHKASAASTAPEFAVDSAPSPPLASAYAAPVNLSELVGLRYGTGTRPPPDLAPFAGWIILPDGARRVDFRITEAYYRSAHVLLLERVHHRDFGNPLLWEILGVLPLPPVPRGYVMVRGTCSFGGRADGSIAAVARSGVERDAPFRAVIQAWRADPETGDFSEIRHAGLQCINKPFDGR